MPMSITSRTGGNNYTSPLVHGPQNVAHIKLDVSALTTDEVDGNGILKPSVPLKANGTLIGAGEAVYGITFEPIQLPGRTNNLNLGTDTSDPIIAVSTSGLVNRDLGEDQLGRAFTANEIAGFAAAGSQLKLTTT